MEYGGVSDERGECDVELFTAARATTLVAVVERLVPADEYGPGGVEVGVVTYIKRTVAADGRLAAAYADGLDAIDALARERLGHAFAALTPDERDDVLRAFEAEPFFTVVHGHALEGMFGDPSYGGNRGFAGWELLGFPGVRRSVPAEHQALDVVVPPANTSRLDLLNREEGT